MYIRNKVNKVLLVTFVTFLSTGILSGQSFADSLNNAPNNQLIPLEITPECSDATTATAYWQVNNKNENDVNITWTNIDNGQTGSYDAAPGLSQLTSYFNSTDPNNTTQFASENNTTQTNATEAACAPLAPVVPPVIAPTCIDGSIQQNLIYTWISPDQISVHTLNDQPLCNDISLDFSSYVMPSNYNGQGFYLSYDQNNPANNIPNPTAFPQTIYDNQALDLSAGTDGSATLTINLPDSCNNTQVDLYYAPEVTNIGPSGNGTSNIISAIYPSTGDCQIAAPTGSDPTNPSAPATTSPVVGGGYGGGSINATTTVTTSASTTPAATAAPSDVPELAYTGASPVIPYLTALGLVLVTSLIAYAVREDARSSKI
jgi:hypothetical protein